MAASTLDMDMAVSRATSLHRRQLHSHTYSCFLELVIQVFSLLLHRATLIGPRSCQTGSHTQEGHTSFLQTWSIGITTTYSDNLLTHTQHNSPGLATHTWEFSCHLHKPPKQPLCSAPTYLLQSSNLPVPPSLGAWCKEHAPSWVMSLPERLSLSSALK